MLNIKELREREQVSLEELAYAINISVEELIEIEEGRIKPSNRILSNIATFFNISLADLVDTGYRPKFNKNIYISSSYFNIWFVIGLVSFLLFVSIILACIFVPPSRTEDPYMGLERLLIEWTLEYIVLKLILVACIIAFICSILFSSDKRKK